MVKMENKESKISKAKKEIINVLKEIKVAYDRELRYRLEDLFPHDITGFAIKELEKEKAIKRSGVPGRRKSGEVANVFYTLPSVNYKSILPLMKQKLELAKCISGVSSDMGRHAEEVWYNAFVEHGWEVYPRNVESIGGIREFKGRKVRDEIGKDLDFIVMKDGIAYGVEIKNRLSYPDDLFWKIIVAADLEVIPMIIARWLNPSQVRAIPETGGVYIVYKTAIYSSNLRSIVEEARELLGYPIECRDKIDSKYFKKRVEKRHEEVVEKINQYKEKLVRFKKDIEKYYYWQSQLGSSLE